MTQGPFSRPRYRLPPSELVAWGVTPVLRYDALGRLYRTDLPNGTFSKVVFDGGSKPRTIQTTRSQGSAAASANRGAAAARCARPCARSARAVTEAITPTLPPNAEGRRKSSTSATSR